MKSYKLEELGHGISILLVLVLVHLFAAHNGFFRGSFQISAVLSGIIVHLSEIDKLGAPGFDGLRKSNID
jgi:hypothetical protein